MDFNYIIQQDTTTRKTINLQDFGTQVQQLSVERQQISLSDLSLVRIDTARLAQARKPAPVIKTIPLIPLNDTLPLPQYDVLSGKMLFPGSANSVGEFNFDALNPVQLMVLPKNTRKEHKAEVKSSNAALSKERTENMGNTDWMLGVIVLILIIFGWVRLRFGRFVQMVFRSSFNFIIARRINEESNVVRSRVFYALNILFFLTFGLFLAQFAQFSEIDIFGLKGLLLFAASTGLLFLVYGIKGAFLLSLDFILLAKGTLRSYNTNVFVYNKTLAFLLLPIVSVIPFVNHHLTEILFNAGFVAIIIAYLGRIVRGFQIGFKIRLSIVYMFLYLCALELLPLLMIFKFIKGLV